MNLVVVLDDWEGRWRASPELERLHGVADVRIFNEHLTRDVLAREVPEAAVLVLNRERTRIDAELLAALPRLRIIVSTGAGLNHVDLDATAAARVRVVTTGGNPSAVVEQTFALMLAAVKRLPKYDAELRAGHFAERPVVGDLAGKRLGLAGLGRIGGAVARIGAAFGMQVAAWSPRLDEEKARAFGVERRANLLELAASSEIFSVHLRLTPETHGIVTAEIVAALPRGALFVNTARAELTDTAALLARAERGEIGLALDVYADEPRIDPRYARVAAALSPHVGWKSAATWEQFVRGGVDRVLEALATPV